MAWGCMNKLVRWDVTDERIASVGVSYVPEVGFNPYSACSAVSPHPSFSCCGREYNMIRSGLPFLCSSSGSYLRPTRLPAGTIGENLRKSVCTPMNFFSSCAVLPPPRADPFLVSICIPRITSIPSVLSVPSSNVRMFPGPLKCVMQHRITRRHC